MDGQWIIALNGGSLQGSLVVHRLANAANLLIEFAVFDTRCLIPWFDGAILSLEWKEA